MTEPLQPLEPTPSQGDLTTTPLLTISHRWGRKLVEFRRMMLVAVPIGAFSGAGVSLLEYICNNLTWDHLSQLPITVRLAFPIIGLLVSGYILHLLQVGTVGMLNEVVQHYHSPPDKVILEEDGLKALACISTVGLGASLGLGGPSQWLGTRIAIYIRHFFSHFKNVRGISKSHIILIGAAAGVSAIFRAPLAGTLLALETPFSKDIDSPVLLPAAAAALVSHLVHGYFYNDHPLLPFGSVESHSWQVVLATGAIGVAAGFLSRRFQRGLTYVRRRTGDWSWWSRALAGGIVTSGIALIAWYFYGDTWTLQGGLPLAELSFSGKIIGTTALALLILKVIAVWATAGTTGVAGVLVVTLTIGSLLGAAVQPLLPMLPPNVASATAVCAYVAANYNAPLTGVALSAEWGGTGLLTLSWFPVLIAAWIGEGLANTPSKKRMKHHHHHFLP